LKHKEESNNIQKQKVLDIIKNNETEKFEKFIYDINNKSLLVEINPQEIISAVASADVRTKQIFQWGLSALFLENLMNPTKNDLDYLTEIKSALDNYLNKQTTRKVSLVYLLRAQNYIDRVIDKYKKRLNIQ